MRRVFHISALILMYLMFTAKSCDNREQADDARNEAMLTSVWDSVKSTFTSDTLSDASLRAFEGNAKIKLSDFNDYLIILDDTSVGKTFREKAGEMIHRLFISENSVLRVTNPDNLGKSDIPISQLLAIGKEGSATFGRIITASIRVQQPLKRAGDSIYTGQLSFSYTSAGQKSEKNLEQAFSDATLDFLLRKHKKTFGTDTLVVWEVFLGEME